MTLENLIGKTVCVRTEDRSFHGTVEAVLGNLIFIVGEHSHYPGGDQRLEQEPFQTWFNTSAGSFEAIYQNCKAHASE